MASRCKVDERRGEIVHGRIGVPANLGERWRYAHERLQAEQVRSDRLESELRQRRLASEERVLEIKRLTDRLSRISEAREEISVRCKAAGRRLECEIEKRVSCEVIVKRMDEKNRQLQQQLCSVQNEFAAKQQECTQIRTENGEKAAYIQHICEQIEDMRTKIAVQRQQGSEQRAAVVRLRRHVVSLEKAKVHKERLLATLLRDKDKLATCLASEKARRVREERLRRVVRRKRTPLAPIQVAGKSVKRQGIRGSRTNCLKPAHSVD